MARKLRALLAALAILAAVPAAADAASGPSTLVNPIIGTSGAVDTFPGPDMPFGMMQLSPDTSPARPDGGGYEYSASQIRGLQPDPHQRPGLRRLRRHADAAHRGRGAADPSGATCRSTHDGEVARAGYYKVTAGGVTTELTDAMRAGVARFTFPRPPRRTCCSSSTGTASQVDGTSADVAERPRGHAAP